MWVSEPYCGAQTHTQTRTIFFSASANSRKPAKHYCLTTKNIIEIHHDNISPFLEKVWKCYALTIWTHLHILLLRENYGNVVMNRCLMDTLTKISRVISVSLSSLILYICAREEFLCAVSCSLFPSNYKKTCYQCKLLKFRNYKINPSHVFNYVESRYIFCNQRDNSTK